MNCKAICNMNSGYFNGVEVLPDGVCYAPEACPMRKRVAEMEAELADVKDQYGHLYLDSAQLAADLEAVDRDFEDIKAERAAARAELAGRDALLTNIAEATGPLDDDGSCPVCRTYSHKGWCWYPALLEWNEALALGKPCDGHFAKEVVGKTPIVYPLAQPKQGGE